MPREYYVPASGRDAARCLSNYYLRRDLNNVITFDEYNGIPYFTANGNEREEALKKACRIHKMRYVPGESAWEWRRRLARKLLREHGRNGCYAIYFNQRTWKSREQLPFTEEDLGLKSEPTPKQLNLF